MASRALLDRFWAKVVVGPADACWPWGGELNSMGYGRFLLCDRTDGRTRVLAHRFAYELATGESTEGHEVLHRCDNPPCCNPAHLWRGTQADNLRDCARKGRLGGFVIAGRRGENHAGALLTEELVLSARCRYAAGGVSMAQLAAEMGVTKSAVRLAIRGLSWRHLPLAGEGRAAS